jgi:DNA-directed RNA polymerase specialized sigma24 family protein
MTRDEYGAAYQKGYRLTVRFLISRGSTWDDAEETAQAAWTRGWEHLGQLRDTTMVLTWVNSIALNLRRAVLRRKPAPLHALPEIQAQPRINLAAIDVKRILRYSQKKDRLVLESQLEGYNAHEIAFQHGWTEMAVKNRLFRARRAAGERVAALRRRGDALGQNIAAAA